MARNPDCKYRCTHRRRAKNGHTKDDAHKNNPITNIQSQNQDITLNAADHKTVDTAIFAAYPHPRTHPTQHSDAIDNPSTTLIPNKHARSTTCMPRLPKVPRLFLLPTELQLQILTPLLKSRYPHPLPVNYKFQPTITVWYQPRIGRDRPPGRVIPHSMYPRLHILHTNSALYTTFLPEYYRINAWLVDLGPLRDYPQRATSANWPHDTIPIARDSVETLHLSLRNGSGAGTWADVVRAAAFPRLRELLIDLRLRVCSIGHIEEDVPLVRVPAGEELNKVLRAAGFQRIKEPDERCLDCEADFKAGRGPRAGGAKANMRRTPRKCRSCLIVWVGDESRSEADRKIVDFEVVQQIWDGVEEARMRVVMGDN